ncbi:hypothetical protein [Streptomyces sp. NBC_00057]|uniref:hypothetical protein n=1 Tax=Streptomyces sp. NBC_00057 TaxID=2975634 RepID=UPI0032499D64
MTTDAPRKRRRLWLGSALLCALAVVAGLTVATNTNALGPRELCDGWLSSEDARQGLGGQGRVTSSSAFPSECTLEQTGWLPGSDDAKVRLVISTNRADDPFVDSGWTVSGDRLIVSGAFPGAFDTYGNGWVSLPASCSRLGDRAITGGPVVLRTLVERSVSDPVKLSRMAERAARAIAGAHNCRPASGSTAGAARYLPASPLTKTDPAKVCGLPGFALAAAAPAGTPVQEQTSGSRDDAWFCDLSLDEPGDVRKRTDRSGTFARLAIIQNPALFPAAREREFERAVCGGKETYFAMDSLSFEWRTRDPKDEAARTFFQKSLIWDRFPKAARTSLGCE